MGIRSVFSSADRDKIISEVDNRGEDETVLSVCKRHGIRPTLVYGWKRKLGNTPRKRAAKSQVLTLNIPEEKDRTIIIIGNSAQVVSALTQLVQMRGHS